MRHWVGLLREEVDAFYVAGESMAQIDENTHISTFLYRPSMKAFDILQKLGRGVSIASDMFLTMVCIASQTS